VTRLMLEARTVEEAKFEASSFHGISEDSVQVEQV